MPRFVALLRGINVGKAKRVPMADLRKLLAALGYRNVETLLNSGNAVFESPARSVATHATRIRAAIANAMQVDVPVIVKSARELAAIQAENSLTSVDADPSRLLVAFAANATDLRSIAVVTPLIAPPEQFQLGRHAACLWCPNGILKSRATAALLGKAGRAVTTRNWATVAKISALLHPVAAGKRPR